jgi:hypothetical protein
VEPPLLPIDVYLRWWRERLANWKPASRYSFPKPARFMADPIVAKEGTVDELFDVLQSFKEEGLGNLHAVVDRTAWHMAFIED